MTTIKSVHNLTFISVVKLDQYGCPEPQYCNLGHERCFKVLPIYQEDRFGCPSLLLGYEFVPYIPEFEVLTSGIDFETEVLMPF